jgi:hypothetical protein
MLMSHIPYLTYVVLQLLSRIEKEKNQLKAEADDLRNQIDHVNKSKVGATQHLYILSISVNVLVRNTKNFQVFVDYCVAYSWNVEREPLAY